MQLTYNISLTDSSSVIATLVSGKFCWCHLILLFALSLFSRKKKLWTTLVCKERSGCCHWPCTASSSSSWEHFWVLWFRFSTQTQLGPHLSETFLHSKLMFFLTAGPTGHWRNKTHKKLWSQDFSSFYLKKYILWYVCVAGGRGECMLPW